MLLQNDDRAAHFIHAMRLEGKTISDIVPDFRAKFPEYAEYGRDRLRTHYNQWIINNGMKPVKKPHKVNYPNHYRFFDKDNKINDPRRASLLHLLDLKRAGHSPTRTELRLNKSPDIIISKPVDDAQDIQQIVEDYPNIYTNETPDELILASYRYVARVPPMQIVSAVARAVGIEPEKITGDYRRQDYVLARHMVYWLTVEAGYGYSRAGLYLNRDHTTILSGVKRFEKHMREGGRYAHTAHFLRANLIQARPVAYWGA